MFYDLVIVPIELVVDWVFNIMTNRFAGFGIMGAIFGVSFVINFLALPLYNVADSIQAKERETVKTLEPRVKRIKKAFKGNEQFMMLSTYYRQNNYHPLYALRGSLSILIEIPFFIAAYHYLSNCEALKGASFWIFKDLGSPDGLFGIGSFKIHILPILMTVINLISGIIYTKDSPMREKIQLIIVSILFLVLLYTSPSGLVLYWILNNLFSLFKNIIMRMKNPSKVKHIILSSILILVTIYLFTKSGGIVKKMSFLFFVLVFTFFPLISNKVFIFFKKKNILFHIEQNIWVVIFSGLGLAMLCGFLLPANVIETSATEFSYLGNTDNPLAYIKHASFVFLGLFLFWPLCIYMMFGTKTKSIVTFLWPLLLFLCLLNAFVFKYDYGFLSITFVLEKASVLTQYSAFFILLPLFIFIVLSVILLFAYKFRKTNIVSVFLFSICIGVVGLGIKKCFSITNTFKTYSNLVSSNLNMADEKTSVFNMSKNGKNVVFLFLDRACGSFLPYAMQEVPDLQNQLKGFTFYPNSVSFSGSTILAADSMMGGYEYVPDEINKRSNELLVKKHNEATMLLPILYKDAGYEVTVADPPFPNYSNNGDLQFLRDIGVDAIELRGKYTDSFCKDLGVGLVGDSVDNSVYKEIKNFSVLQVLPPFLRSIFYGNCRITSSDRTAYVDSVSTLYYLRNLTSIKENGSSYIFIGNDTTHEPVNLQDGFLLPSDDSNSVGSDYYKTDNEDSYMHYQTFVAAIRQLGLWFDYLRENAIYDNTRIVIVSDHGRFGGSLEDFKNFENPVIPSSYNCLLMYKDFYSEDYTIDDTFMTNADTVFLLTDNLGLSEDNPFTNNKLEQKKEGGVSIYPLYGDEWRPDVMKQRNIFTLQKETGVHVQDDIFVESNWVNLEDWNQGKGDVENDVIIY